MNPSSSAAWPTEGGPPAGPGPGLAPAYFATASASPAASAGASRVRRRTMKVSWSHCVLKVRDIEAMTQFYCDTMGWVVADRGPLGPPGSPEETE